MDSQRRNFLKGIGLGTLMGILMDVCGYLLTRGDGTELGWVMFLLVPLVSGFAVSAVVRRPKRVAACCLMAGIISLSVLLMMGWEGIVCCIMSLPLAAGGVAIGAYLGYQARGKVIDRMAQPGKITTLLILLCPLFISGAHRLEQPLRSVQQQEVFTTEMWVKTSPEQTWDLVARMPALGGPRPFLLRVGLPVPARCELDKEAVGGRRVCYFNNGSIFQEVTEWRRPSFMDLRVTGSTLPGRRWLSFVGASYELLPEGEGTRVIRHTTIGTRLYPRWYWRPLERWGGTSEHEFVFSNLRAWTGTH